MKQIDDKPQSLRVSTAKTGKKRCFFASRLGMKAADRQTVRQPAFLILVLVSVLQASTARAQNPSDHPASPKAPAPAPTGAPAPPANKSDQASRERELLERQRAYDFAPDEICPFCVLTPQYPYALRGLHWHRHWRRVGWPEYVAIPVLGGATVAMLALASTESEPDWSGPILFDEPARDLFVFHSTSGRNTARTISDVLFVGSIIHPVVVDNFIVAWWVRKAPDVAWEMFVINAQAYALTLALNTLTKRITARGRPWRDRCPDDTGEFPCDSPPGASFYSGHAAVTATGAGLLCAHHTQLSLYRNDVLDAGSCILGIAGTIVTGATRMASDQHWASDVLMGHLMGYLSGYLMPTLLYYREFHFTPHPVETLPQAPSAPVVAVLPIATDRTLQLSAIGMF